MLEGADYDNPFNGIKLPEGSRIIIALSGGSNSTALMHLAKDNIEQRHLPVTLIAATVDHELRITSGQEAETAGRAAATRGIEHHILHWTGEKPKTGIQNAARQARHRLLADLATRTGAIAVLTGHTHDDQIETILMRGARGKGPGLAGIAPATLYTCKLWFMRPLLSSTRSSLRRYLEQRGSSWIDDPSNDNPGFERVAVRQKLAQDDNRQVVVAAALASAQAASAERQAVSRGAARLLLANAAFVNDHFLLGRAALTDDSVSLHALRCLLASTGGSDLLPDLPRTKAVLEQIIAAQAPRTFAWPVASSWSGAGRLRSAASTEAEPLPSRASRKASSRGANFCRVLNLNRHPQLPGSLVQARCQPFHGTLLVDLIEPKLEKRRAALTDVLHIACIESAHAYLMRRPLG